MALSFFRVSGEGIGRATTGLDLNSDGVSDVVFGDPETDRVTVLFGNPDGFDGPVDLGNLPASAGFRIDGPENAEFGYALAGATSLDGLNSDALLIASRATGEVSVVFNGQTTVGLTLTGLPVLANGISLTSLGDLDGDGFGDFAIGAPDANIGKGAVYAIYGRENFNTTIDLSNLDSSDGFVLEGRADNDLTGAALAGGFDLTGDNRPDLLIGVPGYDDGDSGGNDAGTVYLVQGTTDPITSTQPVSDATRAVTGAMAGNEIGGSLAAGPDVNGDPDADFIISATADALTAGYVVFGGAGFSAPVDLNALDGTNGFAITGTDLSGASVQMLGDVSGVEAGDGMSRIGDIGVVTQSGDVYILFGQVSNTATRDLSALGGTNGYALTGLFDGTPASITITNLGDINADISGPINDIAITASYADDTPDSSYVILGGRANFAALDEADGTIDRKIDFNNLVAPDFVETDPTITIGGDALAELGEDSTTVTGSINIQDSTNPTSQPSFKDMTASGAYGVFLVNEAGDLWTYTRNNAADQQYLNEGDILVDSAILTASNGSQRKITINILGADDPAELDPTSDRTLTVTEDEGLTTSKKIRLIDPDSNDNPTFLNGTKGTGTHGEITIIDDAGGYEYLLTNPELQSLTSGKSTADKITLTANDGSTHDIIVTITGLDEGVPQQFTGGGAINTSYGNDVIRALDANKYVVNAGGGNDRIRLGDGDNFIFDAIGDETITAGNGTNTITLLTGNNNVSTGGGNDRITTGYGNDTINAGTGDDVIAADDGAIFAFGTNRIDGGKGDDLMMGGAGVDTFVFRPNDGKDVIARFDPIADIAAPLALNFQTGIDKIELQGFKNVNAGNVLEYMRETDDGLKFRAENTDILLFNAFVISETDFTFS